LLGLLFDPEDGSTVFPLSYLALQPGRLFFTDIQDVIKFSLPWPWAAYYKSGTRNFILVSCLEVSSQFKQCYFLHNWELTDCMEAG
jgi:hypothetical protein